MYVCNISFQVDPTIEPIWVAWMQSNFIPKCIHTSCFTDSKFYNIDITADQYPTYTLQLFTLSKEKMEEYLTQHASELLAEIPAQWGEQCYHFSTQMKIVN